MTSLITAAEAALAELKEYHRRDAAEILCQGPESCIPARVIHDLEIAIGEAKLVAIMQDKEADPEFQAVAPFKIEDAPKLPPAATLP